MTVEKIIELSELSPLVLADAKREIDGIYCCDLLSVVMSKAFSGCAWVTIMGNINAVAVASLDDMSCIILADGAAVDELMLTKAREQDVNVLQSNQPIFETALMIHELIKENV